MKFSNLTENSIKKFSGSTIFSRGEDYCQSQMVDHLEYDHEQDIIQAEVSGSSGNSYDVEIGTAKKGIDAMCSCPFDGYPCKHIVAVLLTFIRKKDTFLKQAAQNKKQAVSLKDRIKALSKDQLTGILSSLIDKYPDCKKDLLIEIGADSKEVLHSITKQINQIFRAFEGDDYPSSKVIKQLKGIVKSIDKADGQVKAKVYWTLTDRILKELNEYGMDDEALEDMAIDTLNLLAELLSRSEGLQNEKTEIVRALKKYSAWGNCGITDYIDEAIEKLSSRTN